LVYLREPGIPSSALINCYKKTSNKIPKSQYLGAITFNYYFAAIISSNYAYSTAFTSLNSYFLLLGNYLNKAIRQVSKINVLMKPQTRLKP